MLNRFRSAQARRAAALYTMLLLSGSGKLFAQERLRRQQDLTPQEIDSLRSSIRNLGGRAIIGFKPVDAAGGMRADATPALDSSAVRELAEGLKSRDVVVLQQFQSIPAVAVRMDPDRLEELLANPNIDYVEPDLRRGPTGRQPSALW